MSDLPNFEINGDPGWCSAMREIPQANDVLVHLRCVRQAGHSGPHQSAQLQALSLTWD